MTYSETPDETDETVIAGLPEMALGEAAPVTEQTSLFDQLRKKRQEAEEGKVTFIPIPGYDANPPILLARYRVLDGKEIDVIGRKVNMETKDRWERGILAAIDSMIACCNGMYYDELEGEGPQPMTVGGSPITGYTPDLARALDFPANSAREVVIGVFVSNEMAIMQHNVRLGLWMGNTARKVDEDIFSGEF